MNRLEHLLTILGEECSEVHQETCKALRFGIDEKMTIDHASNLERMQIEYNDILAMIDMINDEIWHRDRPLFLHRDINAIISKKEKVEKYLIKSKELGTL